MRAGLVLAVLLLLPLLPASAAPAAAGTCDAATPCAPIPLYLQTGGSNAAGLSALPGDAMPSDASTRYQSTGGLVILNATGPLLDVPITFSRGMELRLPDFTARGDVWGNVTVEALTATGRIPLARVNITPASHEKPSEKAAREANNAVAGGEPALTAIESAARGNIEDAISTIGVPDLTAAGALDDADAASCMQNNVCDQTHARWGAATVRFCGDKAAPLVPRGMSATIGWTIQDQLNATDAPVALCGAGTFDQLQPHAAAVDAATPPLEPCASLPEGACDTPVPDRPHVTRQDPPPTSDPHAARSLRFAAAPPAWIAQDASSFTLPSGVRLVMRLDFTARENTEARETQSAVVFHYGRADVLSALVVSTSTPGAFARLVKDAEAIGEGVHTGMFANATDTDVYALHPPLGGHIRITPFGAPTTYTLYDPDGIPGSIADRIVNKTGTWTLVAARSNVISASAASEHGFVVSYLTTDSEADEGEVGDGFSAGTLGPGDANDTRQLFLWKAQRAEVWIENHSPDLAVVINDTDRNADRAWVVSRASPERLVIEATASGFVELKIVRNFGEGSYLLGVARDAGGDLSDVPFLQPVPGAYDLHLLGETHGAGIDYIGRTPNGSAIISLDGSQHTVVSHTRGPTMGGRTADGSVVGFFNETDASILSVLRGTAKERLVENPHAFALGPSDDFIVRKGSELRRITSERAVETIVTNVSGVLLETRLVFAPDGTLYLLPSPSFSGPAAWRVAGAAVVPSPSLRNLVAFDAQGRAYCLRNDTLIERIDLATGETEIVAQSTTWLRDARVADGVLYASRPGANGHVLIAAAIDAEGWGGFHPDLNMAPLPDVVVTDLEDHAVGLMANESGVVETHDLVIRIENRGEGWMPDFAIELMVSCGQACAPTGDGTLLVGPIAPGETLERSVRISFANDAGDVRYIVFNNVGVDGERPLESNLEWQAYIEDGFVIVGGNQRACRDLVGDAGACAAV